MLSLQRCDVGSKHGKRLGLGIAKVLLLDELIVDDIGHKPRASHGVPGYNEVSCHGLRFRWLPLPVVGGEACPYAWDYRGARHARQGGCVRYMGMAENQQKRAAGMRGKPSRAKNRGCDTSPRASRRVTTSPRTPLGGVVVAAGGVKRCRRASRMRDAGGKGAGEGVKCHAGNGGGRWHKAGSGLVGACGRERARRRGEGV